MGRDQRFVCRFMRFAGMWVLVVSGLLLVGLLIGATKGAIPWFAILFALMVVALGAGLRWLAVFIERELLDWNGPYNFKRRPCFRP